MNRQTIIRVVVIIAIVAVALIGFNMWQGRAATLPGG